MRRSSVGIRNVTTRRLGRRSSKTFVTSRPTSYSTRSTSCQSESLPILKNAPSARPFPPTTMNPNGIASDSARSLALRKATQRVCEDSTNAASAAVQEAQSDERVLIARIEDARRNRDAAVADLAQAREVASDDALAGTLALSQQGADEALKSLDDAQARLEAQDPDSLRSRLDSARKTMKRAIEGIQSNREERNRLRISLDLRGEQGLHTDRDEALDRLRRNERDHDSTKARAEGSAPSV